jgi:hypothetical protein
MYFQVHKSLVLSNSLESDESEENVKMMEIVE